MINDILTGRRAEGSGLKETQWYSRWWCNHNSIRRSVLAQRRCRRWWWQSRPLGGSLVRSRAFICLFLCAILRAGQLWYIVCVYLCSMFCYAVSLRRAPDPISSMLDCASNPSREPARNRMNRREREGVSGGGVPACARQMKVRLITQPFARGRPVAGGCWLLDRRGRSG